MTKTESRLNRLFNIVKTVLMVYPFITLFYLWTTAGQAGTGLSEFMQGNPIITITFITAMLQPFAAWLRESTTRVSRCAKIALRAGSVKSSAGT